MSSIIDLSPLLACPLYLPSCFHASNLKPQSAAGACFQDLTAACAYALEPNDLGFSLGSLKF